MNFYKVIIPSLLIVLSLILLVGCDAQKENESGTKPAETEFSADITINEIDEVFQTKRDTLDNVDSPAVWHGPGDQHWVISTAKYTDVLIVNDAVTGEEIRRVGGSGFHLGQFERPNGIAVVDDYVMVVERDNQRVQILRLPEFEAVGIAGVKDLVNPYGIAVDRKAEGEYRIFVTDNYETEDEEVPADSLLDKRIVSYTLKIDGKDLIVNPAGKFGDTEGPGVLRVVESIAYDPANNTLLLSEEDMDISSVKIYTGDGEFTGKVFGNEFFTGQVEGLALYACADTAGYWIITDQSHEANTFHVFDRFRLEHVGSFTGPKTTNTDGIWLTQKAFGPFTEGAFYAVHNDGNISAFNWKEIADALKLEKRCVN